MLDFEILEVGQLGCNCAILWDTSDSVAVVVDPGEEAERISKAIDRLGVSVKAILLTHAHFDHVGATAPLQELWNCPVLLHPLDMPLLEHAWLVQFFDRNDKRADGAVGRHTVRYGRWPDRLAWRQF